jgi:hypothetical protein
MSTKTAPTPDKTIQHPAWCDPAECGEERNGHQLISVYHWSAEDEWQSRGGDVTASVRLVRVDNGDGTIGEATATFLKTSGGDMALPIDQIDAVAAWLTAKSAEIRQAIATEGGAR